MEGRARKRPYRSRSPSIDDSLFVGAIDGIRTLRALRLNTLRKSQFPNIRDTGLATFLITGVEKSQIASGGRSVGISQ